MKVCFLIPAYNEAATIGEVLERIGALGLDANVIVIDDGSTDGTAELAEAAGARVVRKANGGKGSAIRAGIAVAEGDIAVIQDADMEYDVETARHDRSSISSRHLRRVVLHVGILNTAMSPSATVPARPTAAKARRSGSMRRRRRHRR